MKMLNMTIHNTIRKLKDKMETSYSLPWREDFGGYLLQRGYLLYQNLFIKRHWGFAAQLTFNTFMALIPAFAIIFAIGKGLGFEGYILSWCKYVFSAQPQVYNAIVSLSESYIQYVHTRVFVIAGIAVMLWSVISLFMDIESVFNDIWGVKEDRPLQKRLIYYIAIIFCVPIVIILCSSFTIYSYLLLDYLPVIRYITPVMHWATGIIVPVLLMWLFFLCLYTCIPHTPVPVRHALWPSLLASFCIMLLQMAYIHLQVLVSSYSIIYGSLAAIPLLLLWLQISWYISIGCAELTHANQDLAIGNVDKTAEYTMNEIIAQCLIILDLLIDRQQKGYSPLRFTQLRQRTCFSRPELLQCLARMEVCGIVYASPSRHRHDKIYTLSQNTQDIQPDVVVARLMNSRLGDDGRQVTDAKIREKIKTLKIHIDR